jgi:hypothetical protein
MSTTGRTRASVELRSAPNGAISDALGPDVAVTILEEQGDWLKVRPEGLSGAVEGFAPRLAIALPPPAGEPVFPAIALPDGDIPSVPRSLKAQTLVEWVSNPVDPPSWIPANIWQQLDAPAQEALHDDILAGLQNRQLEWEDWQRYICSCERQAEATLDEWLVTLEGGRNMWSIRAERIYKQPSQNVSDGYIGWMGDKDILLWTGLVRCNPAESKYKTWYEVRLYKFRKELRGWYKADLLTDYLFPGVDNDPSDPSNAGNIFDLSQSLIRHPADQAITDAQTAKRNAWQYIDVKPVTGRKFIHHNLCGEFCVAAVLGSDILPLLSEWLKRYPRANNILNQDIGTGLPDLLSLLAIGGKQGQTFQYSSGVSQISPASLRQILQGGQKAIIGVGITSKGVLSPQGKIRHWVVLEDVEPVGSSGWMRVYNPFFNQEEVYSYRDFLGSMGNFGIGLWVEHATV